ncbi:hypothetical protein KI387_038487, partial [Taxus chinensis]
RMLPVLQTHETMAGLAVIEVQFDDEDIMTLSSLYVTGLSYVAEIPQITLDHGLLMARAEQWHSKSQCFHLPTGEMTITLED